MPMDGIVQPEILPVSADLRLRRYDGQADFALDWYQDEETLMLVDGKNFPYDLERLYRMYTYLDKRGELYFIERLQEGAFVPIGDVTLCRDDLPIVIGERSLRGRGIGRQVVEALARRAKSLGFSRLLVREIYSWNLGSQKMFEAVGFVRYTEEANGYGYRMEL